jgi:2-phosphoglycolate phosphatase
MMERWRPEAVLFDFDGTLADSYAAITSSVNHVRATHGLPPLDELEVRRHVGRGPEHLLQHTVPSGELAANLASYRAHHPAVMRRLTQLLPGARDTVLALHQAGLKLGVCSNKPSLYTRALLETLGIATLFSVVVGPEDVPRLKPAPDMLLAALTKLGVPPDAALYIGDMVVDIECARAAGIRVWVVPTGSEELARLRESRPDRILRDLTELTAILNLPS